VKAQELTPFIGEQTSQRRRGGRGEDYLCSPVKVSNGLVDLVVTGLLVHPDPEVCPCGHEVLHSRSALACGSKLTAHTRDFSPRNFDFNKGKSEYLWTSHQWPDYVFSSIEKRSTPLGEYLAVTKLPDYRETVFAAMDVAVARAKEELSWPGTEDKTSEDRMRRSYPRFLQHSPRPTDSQDVIRRETARLNLVIAWYADQRKKWENGFNGETDKA
jgi:hypothetical protein